MKSLNKALSKKWTLLTVISVFIFSACHEEIDQLQKKLLVMQTAIFTVN